VRVATPVGQASTTRGARALSLVRSMVALMGRWKEKCGTEIKKVQEQVHAA
jgi:hypothetical protein